MKLRQAADLCRQGRRDHRSGLFRKERDDIGAVGPGCRADTDRHVEAVAGAIDRPGRGRQPYVDTGMFGLEAIKPRDQPAHREGAGAGDIERAIAGIGNGAHRHVDLIEGGDQSRQQRLASLRQPHPVLRSFEQRYAKNVLKMLDLAADGAVRHVQLFGRQRHAAVAACGFEGAKRIEGGQTSCHVRFRNNPCSSLSVFIPENMMFSPVVTLRQSR